VGPRTGLDAVEKVKIFPLPGIETRAVQPVAIPTETSRLLQVSLGLINSAPRHKDVYVAVHVYTYIRFLSFFKYIKFKY
jgi:hypothetical protein